GTPLDPQHLVKVTFRHNSAALSNSSLPDTPTRETGSRVAYDFHPEGWLRSASRGLLVVLHFLELGVDHVVTGFLGLLAGTGLGGLTLLGVHLLGDRCGGLRQSVDGSLDGGLVVALHRCFQLADGFLDRRLFLGR